MQVLSFSFLLHKADGVHGTNVVACHACGAVSVPCRMFFLDGDIMQRTYLSTFTTADARVGGSKIPVGYQQAVKQRPDNITFQTRQCAWIQSVCVELLTDNIFNFS